jgi:Fur family ferric uptake transcriptional regulator
MNVKSPAAEARRNFRDEAQAMQEIAQTQLRHASVRVTQARVKVLAALLGANRAFSHHEVQDRFADMDRVTLYRALDCLIEAGLAHKIAGDDRIFRYSAGTDHANQRDASHDVFENSRHQHGHFKCTRCAKVFCLDKKVDAVVASGDMPQTANHQFALYQQLQSEIQKVLGEGFRSHDIELTVKGWCADCAH